MTYKDYKNLKLNDGERAELINGFAYAMSSPGTEHQLIVSTLNAEFYNFLKGKTCKALPSPYDVRLFYKEDNSDDAVVQPDLVVVCDPGKLGKEGCRGAPDLVIEILSPSNTAMEMNMKKNLYLKARVPEYWIIDPEVKQIEINRLENGEYIPHILRMGDILRSFKFEDFSLSLDDLFAQIS